MYKLYLLWFVGICLSLFDAFESDVHVINIESFGAKPDDRTSEVVSENTRILESSLKEGSNKRIVVPNSGIFYVNRGIYIENLENSVIEINGILSFRYGYEHEARDEYERPVSCLSFVHTKNVTFTSVSDSRGMIDGGGRRWWGLPFWGYIERKEDRPFLLQMNRTENLILEKLSFHEAPFYTIKLDNVNGVVIRYVSIVNRRTVANFHSWLDLSAFNTDGIDVAGHNVYVHDVDIWNQDDCIAVKDNFGDGISSNMTFERISASGLGLVIGSIGNTHVRNITFRDSILYRTVKGLYLKFRISKLTPENSGIIENILYDNITIEEPMQYGVWIGPAQQAGGDSAFLCSASPCSLCWPYVPGTVCKPVTKSVFRNITMRRITINNPGGSPGVFIGSQKAPIEDIVFDSVVVTRAKGIVSTSELVKLFPGLSQSPVDDNYALDGKNFFLLAITLLFLFLLCAYLWKKVFQNNVKDSTTGCSLLAPEKPNTLNRQRTWSEEKKTLDGRYKKSKQGDKTGATPIEANSLHRGRTWSEEKKSMRDHMTLWQKIPWKGGKSIFTNISRLEIPQKRVYWKHAAIGVIYLTTLLALMRFIRVSRHLGDPNEYYVCPSQGVMNAIAKGETWPVPSCFEDNTIKNDFERKPIPHVTSDSSLFAIFIILLLTYKYLIFYVELPSMSDVVRPLKRIIFERKYERIGSISKRPSMHSIVEHEEFQDFDFP